jgi:hypothetical protein
MFRPSTTPRRTLIGRILFVVPAVLVAVAGYVAFKGAGTNNAMRFVVYRPSTGHFYIDKWTRPGERLDVEHRAELVVPFGRPGDIGFGCLQSSREEPFGLRVYADGAWYFSAQMSRPPGGDLLLGKAGDVPFCADFDGDGRADNGVFSAGQWLVRTHDGALLRFDFGMGGDRPLVVNAHGRGNDRDRRNLIYGVYRAGIWYLDLDGDSRADVMHAFGGQPNDVALLIPRTNAGDGSPYSLAIFRDGLWFVKGDPNDAATQQFYFGSAGDVPSVLYEPARSASGITRRRRRSLRRL